MSIKTKWILLSAFYLTPALAGAATTATLDVSGTVPTVRYIGWGTTPDTTTSSSLDVSSPTLAEAGSKTFQAPLQLKEVTNDPFHNYAVTVTSRNGGMLKHASLPTNTIKYDLYISGATVTGTLATSQSYTVNTASYTGLTTVARDVSVTVTGNPSAAAGRYDDTISFEITPP